LRNCIDFIDLSLQLDLLVCCEGPQSLAWFLFPETASAACVTSGMAPHAAGAARAICDLRNSK
jgi:hypothetical protein